MDDDKKPLVDEALKRFAERIGEKPERISESNGDRLQEVQEAAKVIYDRQRGPNGTGSKSPRSSNGYDIL